MVGSQNENWVFLGDSISEGVGPERVSYVSEIVKLLRAEADSEVVDFRLRRLAEGSFSKFVRYNVAGNICDSIVGKKKSRRRRWIWNLASEGTTAQDDSAWFPLIENLRPSRVFVLRGPFESLVRPGNLVSDRWPFWVPRSWRTPYAMDPRCYFSSTWWRAAKQRTVDLVKQRIRLKLLEATPRTSLLSGNQFRDGVSETVRFLQTMEAEIWLLGIPCVSEMTFPGSQEEFHSRNNILRVIAKEKNTKFLQWAAPFFDQTDLDDEHFYRDGFHPNPHGAQMLAFQLFKEIEMVDSRA